MRRGAVGACAIIAMAVSAGFYHASHGRSVVSVRMMPMNVKDLPEHGLRIIAPSNPSFAEKAAHLFGEGITPGDPPASAPNPHPPLLEALKPFAVLLENGSNMAVVAYVLKWEMTRSDGTVFVRKAGGSNARALMDGAPPGMEESGKGGYVIQRNSIQYVDLASSGAEGGSISAYAWGASDRDVARQFEKAARQEIEEKKVNLMTAELRACKSLTVSVDGVFFEDGSFVGPDSTGGFAQIKANIDAEHDLLDEVAFALNHNRSFEQILDYVREIVGTENAAIQSLANGELYDYYKVIYAKEILRMTAAMDARRAILTKLQMLRKPWPVLHKRGTIGQQ